MASAADVIAFVHEVSVADLTVALGQLPSSEFEKVVNALAAVTSEIVISVVDCKGETLWGPDTVCADMQVAELLHKSDHNERSLRKSGASVHLTHGTQVVLADKTLRESGVVNDVMLTATYHDLKSHVYVYGNNQEGKSSWQLRWSAPVPVKQMVVGPYDVYALLRDGCVWYVGHTEGEYWERGPTCLDTTCIGAIEKLFIEYTHPVFTTSNGEVWVASIMGDGLTPVLGLLKEKPGTEDGENKAETKHVSEEEQADSSADGKNKDSLGLVLTRLDRLSGKNMTHFCSNQSNGVALVDGKAFVFMTDSETFGLTMDAGFDMPEDGLFIEVDLAGRRAMKSHMDGILLDSGEIALLYGMKRTQADSVSCQLAKAESGKILNNIIDISSTGRFIALDKAGTLWSPDASKTFRLHAVPTTPMQRIAGEVAVSARDSETAFAFGHDAGVAIASAARIGEIAAQDCNAQAAWVEVSDSCSADPGAVFNDVELGLVDASESASNQFQFVTNVLSASISKPLELKSSDADAQKVSELLKQGANPQPVVDVLKAFLPQSGQGLQVTCQERLGVTPAIWRMLMEAGASSKDVVDLCVDEGDIERLDLLEYLGVAVSEELKTACRANSES
eukprot:TRINITY_DN6527_c0_g1_i1.p1 TRINITY_DN6527_c0_g1~~TRINITY_DN6527_c0_g1_i1.p1  ORF type:complete len:620 (-),score=72.93 TRINITY_DN6527_c0_g1_i1:278-2137(-)